MRIKVFPLGPLEREVMEEIWKKGRGLSVREILDAINERKSVPYAYTTILTVCQHLEKKGFLRKERVGKFHVYHPTVDRDTFYKRSLAGVLGVFARQYPDVAFSFFVDTVGLSEEDVEKILKKLSE